MTAGRVVDLHAFLPITFSLPGRRNLAIEFVIDTGFTGYLTLPADAVAALELPFLESIPASLADDTEVELAVHEATILWLGQEIGVRVLATGRRPLLGTALLRGQELVAQFTDGGLVTVDAL